MAKKDKTTLEEEIAIAFKALGDPTRLRIFRYLRDRCWPVTVEDGEEQWMHVGPTVSEVCAAVSDSKKITAKVSHHLKEMRLAGLIQIKRRGKHMICGIERDSIRMLAEFLTGSPERIPRTQFDGLIVSMAGPGTTDNPSDSLVAALNGDANVVPLH
ncbi:MAG: ArsR/SmtB family transcription factor [Capsulimonadaceae bacterium]